MATNQLTSKQLRNIFIAELNAQGITGENQAAVLGQAKKEMQFHPKYLVESASDKNAEAAYGLATPKKARELGNIKLGDGAKYKGRGYIQLTGRNNYKKVGEELFLDGVIDDPDLLINNPDILKTDPRLAAKASVKFLTLDSRFQDALAKPTLREKVDGMTRIINGGLFSDPSKKHEGGMTYQEDIDLRFKNAENFNKQLILNSDGTKVAIDGVIKKGGETETAWDSKLEREGYKAYPTETTDPMRDFSERSQFAQTDPRRVDLAQPVPQAQPTYDYIPQQPVPYTPSAPMSDFEQPQYATIEDLLADRGLMGTRGL